MLCVDADIRLSADNMFNHFGLIDFVESVEHSSIPDSLIPPIPSKYDTSHLCGQKNVSFGDANKF